MRTARTLPEGGSDLSFAVSVTRISLREVVVDGTRIPVRDFYLPNPVPELIYDYGVSDDVELGARLSVGSGLVDAHAKLRFVEAARGTLHLALAPAVGYRALALVKGPVLTLPLLITVDLSSGTSLSGGPLVSYASYSMPHRFRVGELDLRGDTLYAGGGLGLELRPVWGIHVMPAVELQRSVSRRGDLESLPVVDMVFLGVTFGGASQRGPAPNDAPERSSAPD